MSVLSFAVVPTDEIIPAARPKALPETPLPCTVQFSDWLKSIVGFADVIVGPTEIAVE